MDYRGVRYLILLFLLVTMNAFALPANQFLVMENCSLPWRVKYEELAHYKDLRLLKISQSQLDKLLSFSTSLDVRCKHFFNATSAWNSYSHQKKASSKVFLKKYWLEDHPGDLLRGYHVQYQNTVTPLLLTIDQKKLKTHLETLSDFPDRYVYSENGVEAAKWLKQQAEQLAANHDNVKVYVIPTKGAKQSSVVLRIGHQVEEPAVVLGAHFDTLAGQYEDKPGADDNGSGVVTLLETARVLLNSSLSFKKPIYFVWYAGEEEGKLGSQSVVQYFKQHKIPVDGVLQLDKTGYADEEEKGIGLAEDYTDSALTAFVADLNAQYVKLPIGAVRVGYASSDHFTWYLNGNRVAYPLENRNEKNNPYAHTSFDNVNHVSMEHVLAFTKLSVAFAVELAEPV